MLHASKTSWRALSSPHLTEGGCRLWNENLNLPVGVSVPLDGFLFCTSQEEMGSAVNVAECWVSAAQCGPEGGDCSLQMTCWGAGHTSMRSCRRACVAATSDQFGDKEVWLPCWFSVIISTQPMVVKLCLHSNYQCFSRRLKPHLSMQ